VTKGQNNLSRIEDGIPGPESCTSMSAWSPDLRATIVINDAEQQIPHRIAGNHDFIEHHKADLHLIRDIG
jgi:hypothetical protein